MVEDEVDDDGEAGPELPPDFDAEEDVPDDDEEGRFFGGGMDRQTAQAMQYIDQQDQGEAAVCTIGQCCLRLGSDCLSSLRNSTLPGCAGSPSILRRRSPRTLSCEESSKTTLKSEHTLRRIHMHRADSLDSWPPRLI